MPLNELNVAGSKKISLWLRWWGIALGGATLFWLPVEDTEITILGLVSAGWGSWLAGWLYPRDWFGMRRLGGRLRQVMAGGLAGLLLPLAAFGLVVLKAGLHGHGFLDFSFYQLGQLLARTPVWVGLGCLAGGLTTLVGKTG